MFSIILSSVKKCRYLKKVMVVTASTQKEYITKISIIVIILNNPDFLFVA